MHPFFNRKCPPQAVYVAVQVLENSIYKTFSKLFEGDHIKICLHALPFVDIQCNVFVLVIATSLPLLEANLSISTNIYKDLCNMSMGAVLKHLIHVFRSSTRPEVPLQPSNLVALCLEPLCPNYMEQT